MTHLSHAPLVAVVRGTADGHPHRGGAHQPSARHGINCNKPAVLAPFSSKFPLFYLIFHGFLTLFLQIGTKEKGLNVAPVPLGYLFIALFLEQTPPVARFGLAVGLGSLARCLYSQCLKIARSRPRLRLCTACSLACPRTNRTLNGLRQ